METKVCKNIVKKWTCEKCAFKCSLKTDYERHILTAKHQKSTVWQPNYVKHINPVFTCEICNKEYKDRSGLWKHKKKCTTTISSIIIAENDDEEEEESKPDMHLLTGLIIEMMKSNQDLQKSLIEVCKDKNSITHNNNMINSHNKTFNLQVFLNETCKDAMNLTDFVNSLQIQLSDLENVGKNGFVAGISNLIIENLKALDVTQRPVHCSDQKREVIYIKDQDQWSKEGPGNFNLKKAIKQIAHKNICMIPEWKTKYPDCVYSESKKSDLYNHIMYEAMDNNEANSEKIIKRIAKEMGIHKY